MMGFKFVKAGPNTHVIQFRNGKIVREGAGKAFHYYAPRSSLASIPVASTEAPFIFEETSADYQQVTVQGQVSFRVVEPRKLATMMNFTLKADGSGYEAEDPKKLSGRVLHIVQVQLKSAIGQRPLQETLTQCDPIVGEVRKRLVSNDALNRLGIEITDLAVTAVKPNPDTARALEAKVREAILKDADDAIYIRRNAAIEQERRVKENELNTERAIVEKQREIREAEQSAEREELERQQAFEAQEMAGRQSLERDNQTLVTLQATNRKTMADAEAYAAKVTVEGFGSMGPEVLEALMLTGSQPEQLIARAFKNLATNAEKIGELNITPDFLQGLRSAVREKGAS